MPIERKGTPPTSQIREHESILDHLSAWTHDEDVDQALKGKKKRGSYVALSTDGNPTLSTKLQWWFDPDSDQLNIFIGLVIICNAIVIGFETEYGRDSFSVFEHCFNTVFFVEMILRMRDRFGWEYWTDPWNIFDFSLVCIGTMDLWIFPAIEHFTHSDFNSGVGYKATLLRLLRLLRIVRVIRLFRVFNQLHLVMLAFNKAFSIVVLISILVFLLDYVLAILLTQSIGDNAADYGEHQADIEMRFGTIPRSMQSLFLIMTLSGWETLADMLSEVIHPALVYFLFVAYLLVTSYTMISLITGIISDSLVMAQQDHRRKKLNVHEIKRKEMETDLRNFLHDIHDEEKDAFGNIPPDDLKTSMRGDTQVLQRLAEINIVMDEKAILDLIDKMTDDGRTNANIDYFVNKLVNLHGQASASALIDLKYEMHKTQRKLRELQARLGGTAPIEQTASEKKAAQQAPQGEKKPEQKGNASPAPKKKGGGIRFAE